MSTSIQVVIDCADPAKLSQFWATALHYKLDDPPPGFDTWPAFLEAQGVPESEWNSASAVSDPDGNGPRIYFQQVPEAKQVKNRLHLDLNVGGGSATPLEQRQERIAAEVTRLEEAGARVAKPGAVSSFGEYWVIMQDPEGNEFCLQ
ncbi:MAG: VOC family protein [Actinomycetota bacterium]|nr:VOC family protein [Actinomycetota bacterium]